MNPRIYRKELAWVIGLALISPLPVWAQNSWREPTVYPVEAADWNGPVLANGHPDVQGHWSNTVGNHNNMVDPQGNFPYDDNNEPQPPRPNRENRAPSRLVAPADGEFPFQPWARALQQEFAAHLFNAFEPQYVEPLARCAPGGPTKSLMWHGFEIRQDANHVLFLFDSGTRVIHLDDKPVLHENISLWNGDSRGHWEGNALVVTVANHNAKSRFGRTGEFVSDNATLEERFIFESSGNRFLYQGTYTDPTVLTAPITFEIPVRRITTESELDGWNNITFPVNFADSGRAPEIEAYERTCAENNANHGAESAFTAAN